MCFSKTSNSIHRSGSCNNYYFDTINFLKNPLMQIISKMNSKLYDYLLPTSQPSEDTRLVRRQHYRAVRKYRVGGKNLE